MTLFMLNRDLQIASSENERFIRQRPRYRGQMAIYSAGLPDFVVA